MGKEAENRQNRPPHSGFAMFFYRIFFAVFGAFEDKINEQNEYYRKEEKKAKQLKDAAVAEKVEAAKAVKEAKKADHLNVYAEKITELHTISNQMENIQNGYCYTMLSNLYSADQVTSIYEHYNSSAQPGQKETNNSPVMMEAVGTIAAIVSNAKREGMSEADTYKLIDGVFGGNAKEKDSALNDIINKGRETYRAALQGKADLDRTMGDIFVDASRTLTKYIANGVPVSAKQVFAGRTLKKMMDILPFMNPNDMASMKNDLDSDANYNAAFQGAIKIGEIGARGLRAQYKLIDDKSSAISDDKYMGYYKDYKALKAVEYGLAVSKAKEGNDYPLIQKGIGNKETQDKIVKELRSMEGNEFKEKAEPYERTATKNNILNNTRSLQALGKNTYEQTAAAFKLMNNEPQKENVAKPTNEKQIGGVEKTDIIPQIKNEAKVNAK